MTNLYNFAQPLIRYEVPDLVTMATKPCPCGRPYRLVAKVEGRSDDILYLRNEHGQDVPIHPLHVRSAMARFEEVNEYQVIHNADGIHLRVVLREGASAEKVAIQLKAKLRGALESVRVRCPEVHIEFMDRIQRDLRQMGKLKLVLSTLPRPGA